MNGTWSTIVQIVSIFSHFLLWYYSDASRLLQSSRLYYIIKQLMLLRFCNLCDEWKKRWRKVLWWQVETSIDDTLLYSSEMCFSIIPLRNLDDLSLMFVAAPRSRTRSGHRRANSDGVADPLIKLINSRQVTRGRYGRQVNSNVGLETGWLVGVIPRVYARLHKITPNPPRVHAYFCTRVR